MRKIILTVVWTMLSAALCAQTVLEDLRRDILCSANNYMAYPGPRQTELTPAPRGMQPFYISHYGRHGSRYHSKPSMYNAPYLTLQHADSLGKLTPLGRDVLQRLDLIRQDATNRWGELTPLGARQHRDIARRMMERFPEVFEGKTDVDARSTTVGRCIMSMEYALMEMLLHNPQLNIHHDATHRDMDDLNHQDKQVFAMKTNKASMDLYRQYTERNEGFGRLMRLLFNDTAYVHRHVNENELSTQLLLVAAIMQNTELGKHVTLYDLFDLDDTYRIWQVGNVRWYIGWGSCPVNGGIQPYTQAKLLRRIIAEADSAVAQPKNKVNLRFGHETVILPLVSLIDINGLGLSTWRLDSLEERGWVNYRIIPMAANIQLVFYRRHPADRDVLLKVLLNENEATLPLPTDTPPYYRWSDVRAYCLRKLDTYEKGGSHE